MSVLEYVALEEQSNRREVVAVRNSCTLSFMNTLILFKRTCRVSLARSAIFCLLALLSACGGGGSPAGQAASPVAANVPAAPLKPADAVQAEVAVSALAAAIPCAGPTCRATPIDAIAILPDASYSPYSPYPPDAPDGPGYLVASTDMITTAGEPPYPDLRTLPTRVRPFQAMAFGDTSVFNVAPLR